MQANCFCSRSAPSLLSFSSTSWERLDIVKQQKWASVWRQMKWSVVHRLRPSVTIELHPSSTFVERKKNCQVKISGCSLPLNKGRALFSTTQTPLSFQIMGWLSLANKMTEEMVICRAGEGNGKGKVFHYQYFAAKMYVGQGSFIICRSHTS